MPATAEISASGSGKDGAVAALDLVDWPAERTLRVTGSPSSLRVPITLSNSSDTMQAGGAPVLVELKDATGRELPVQSVGTLPAVAARGVAPGRLRVRLDPMTPPGSYEGRVTIAGIIRPLRINIVETIALALSPAPLMLDVTAGQTQRAAISVENRGNVALTIDLAGEYPLGEELPLLAGVPTKPETANGIEKLLAILQPQTRRAPPLREIGKIGIAMPQGAARIEPGEAATITLDLTLSTTLAPTSRYRAFIPLYGEDLAIVVITAVKSKSAGPKPRPRSKGDTR